MVNKRFKIYSDGVIITSKDLEYSKSYVNTFGGTVKDDSGKILYQKILEE
jgi:hypothetical protein